MLILRMPSRENCRQRRGSGELARQAIPCGFLLELLRYYLLLADSSDGLDLDVGCYLGSSESIA